MNIDTAPDLLVSVSELDAVMKPAPFVNAFVLVGMAAPVIVSVPSEFVDVVMLVPPCILKSGLLKENLC